MSVGCRLRGEVRVCVGREPDQLLELFDESSLEDSEASESASESVALDDSSLCASDAADCALASGTAAAAATAVGTGMGGVHLADEAGRRALRRAGGAASARAAPADVDAHVDCLRPRVPLFARDAPDLFDADEAPLLEKECSCE